jgi:LPXTG-motif cell wall-anchored protein
MKKTIHKIHCILVLIALLATGLFIPSALADAAEVWVNNVKLDASGCYLANGSTIATTTKPTTGGYAYFDASASTLMLYHAVIDDVTQVDLLNKGLIYAADDLNVVFIGDNFLSYNGSVANGLHGIIIKGSSTFSGSGSATIEIQNSGGGTSGYGVFCSAGDLSIFDCTLNIYVQADVSASGITVSGNILVSGSDITAYCKGNYSKGVYCPMAQFRMTSGKLSMTAEATTAATALNQATMGLYANGIFLEGGEGIFKGVGPSYIFGIESKSGTINVSGGYFRAVGDTAALYFNVAAGASPVYNLTGVSTFVSEDVSGSGSRLWISIADGELASTTSSASPFHYVQFIADVPQTGDGARPWLWAGLGAAAAAGAVAFIIILRKRRR